MTTSSRRSIVSAIVLCILLAACSGEDEQTSIDSGGPRLVDACTLLQTEEIAAVLGVKIEPGKQGHSTEGSATSGRLSSCSWESADDPAQTDAVAALKDKRYVNLMVWTWPAGSNGASNYMDGMRTAANQNDVPQPSEVAIGDDALYFPSQGLHVRKQDANFTLSVTGLKQSDQTEIGKLHEALAKHVIERL